MLRVDAVFLVVFATVAPAAVSGAEELTPKERLGKKLFFDNISSPDSMSCATCHSPETGFSGPLHKVNSHGAVHPGAIAERFSNRKPPTAAYATLSPVFHYDEAEGLFVGGNFSDGRATGEILGNPAADQALGPLMNPVEHNNLSKKEVLKQVAKSEYASLWEAVWGEPIQVETEADVEKNFNRIGLAVAAYEDSAEVNPFSSKYDYYLKGMARLTAQEKEGLELFNGKGLCAECHPSEPGKKGEPPLFTDFTYDNLGTPKNPKNPFYRMDKMHFDDGTPINPEGAKWIDPGLGGFLKTHPNPRFRAMAGENMGKHKVPTLRNVGKVPHRGFQKAYMHNGVFKSLKEVVHFYNTRDVKEWPAPEVAENVNSDELGDLGLTEEEEDAIVAFMETLSDGYVPRFIQDHFAVGFWVDPPADANMERHYQDIAAANFTMVLGGFGARTPQTVQRQIALCEKYGLKAVVSRAGLPPESLPEGPVVWGYAIRDEPGAKDFPTLRKTLDGIRKARPGKLGYINLFPNYANERQLGTKTYDEHVRRFCEEVGVDVLSMDHYPFMKPGADTRDRYCENLAVMRKYALKHDIPFWNFFNTMPFGSHFDPTEAQLRWQVYTSIAYGAKGVLYFCYWTPRGGEFPKGGAIITAEGRKTRHYEQAKRINRGVKNLGPTLMQASSTAVVRIRPDDDPAALVGETPVKNLTKGDYLLGVFKLADGRRAVLLNNYAFAYTAWPTVEFDVPTDQVREISKETGKEIPVTDDSPDMEGLQLSLDSGEGRLFILP